MGGCSEFRGNGIVVRRDLLIRAGGWRAEALAEDLDLSSRVAIVAGERVAWAIDAEVWEEPVETWESLWKQRPVGRGALRRPRARSRRAADRRLPLAARLDFAAYAGPRGAATHPRCADRCRWPGPGLAAALIAARGRGRRAGL